MDPHPLHDEIAGKSASYKSDVSLGKEEKNSCHSTHVARDRGIFFKNTERLFRPTLVRVYNVG